MRRVQITFSTSFLVVVLICLLTTPTPTQAVNMRLCGQRLTTMLMSLCKNRLCAGGMQKREAVSTAYRYMLFNQVKRGGIATQCCENKCSMQLLKTYCCHDDSMAKRSSPALFDM